MSGFDDATRIDGDGDHGWSAEIHPDWSIAGRTNGGYLLALAARAAVAGCGLEDGVHAHPVAATAAYLAPAPPGPATLTTQVVRQGRTTSVVRVDLVSEGQTCVEALVTCGNLPSSVDDEPWHAGEPVPSLPAETDCPRLPVDGPGFRVPLMGVVCERLDPACLGWVEGRPRGLGELVGHLRLDDGRQPDPLSLLLAVDALPPATFDLGLTGWVPTLQMSAWVRALPAPGPLVVRQRARHGVGDVVDETCDVWDSRGHLVATGHQLAGVRR